MTATVSLKSKALLYTFLCVFLLLLCTSGCEKKQDTEGGTEYPLEYARGFSAVRYDGYYVVDIGDDRFYIADEGVSDENFPQGVSVIHKPVGNMYIASSSVMDMLCAIDSLDRAGFTSTDIDDWRIDEVISAMEDEDLVYVGKYSSPDLEYLVSEHCSLAVENTMIYHSPTVMDQLMTLGIPVMVERSSYEESTEGRLEWIKLYGILCGKETDAERFFDDAVSKLHSIGRNTPEIRKKAAFFYFTSTGTVNIRKPGDYISRLIELSGGEYAFTADMLNVDDNALATMSVTFESFYSAAKDCDILFYNANIIGEVQNISQLTEKQPLLADFEAVKSGEVYVVHSDMFQKSTAAAELAEEMQKAVNGELEKGKFIEKLDQ